MSGYEEAKTTRENPRARMNRAIEEDIAFIPHFQRAKSVRRILLLFIMIESSLPMLHVD